MHGTSRPQKKEGGPVRTRTQAGQRLSRFVFTLNNPTDAEESWFPSFANSVKWLIIGKEVGKDKGTYHLQGACVLGRQLSFSSIKALPGLSRAHIEPMRGTPEDSYAYCSKDGDFQVWGALPKQGKRSDLITQVDRIRDGASLQDLAGDSEGGAAIVKFHKGLTVLRSLVRPKRTGPPVVFWIHGDTGFGKTRAAFSVAGRFNELLGGKPDDVWISSGGLRWFDGYDGQQSCILDDFRAKHVSSFAFLLRLLDRYPMAVEFKGGFVSWTPGLIIITSPKSLEDCFRTRNEHIPEDIAQLRRRVVREFELESRLDGSEYDNFVNHVLSCVPEECIPVGRNVPLDPETGPGLNDAGEGASQKLRLSPVKATRGGARGSDYLSHSEDESSSWETLKTCTDNYE